MFKPQTAQRWSLLVGVLALGGCAASSARAPSPSVVWSGDHRAYLGTHDPDALGVGDSIEFVERGRTVATGRVARIGDGELATVPIGSGGLENVKDLKRLSVRVHRRAPEAMDRLRVGFPSAKRGTALFACRSLELRTPGPAGAFAAGDSGGTRIFVRGSTPALGGPWPHRLEARRFAAAADEEIALERGEIDVAVFWPGELSARLRKDPRWGEFPMGTRSRGVVAVEWTGVADSLPIDAGVVFDALNRDAFRRDLGSLAPVPMNPATGPSGLGSVRFEADPRCPGHAELQRVLDRAVPARTTTTASGRARLLYLDEPFSPEPRREAGGVVVPLFTIRCPVVCAPELRAYVQALSPDSLVNLIDCQP
jgi:hypothetical protein